MLHHYQVMASPTYRTLDIVPPIEIYKHTSSSLARYSFANVTRALEGLDPVSDLLCVMTLRRSWLGVWDRMKRREQRLQDCTRSPRQVPSALQDG